MASNKKITVAVAGEAATDLSALKALLNDWFGYGKEDAEGYPKPPANEIEFLIPGPTGLSDSVKTFMQWVDYANANYTLVTDDADDRKVRGLIRNAFEVEETKNVAATMIELLEQAEGDKYLFLLWGEDGDDFSESLLELAEAADIPAKDLTGGLDDLFFGDDPEAETAAAPEAPKKGAEQPLEEEEIPLEEDPATPLPETTPDEAQQLPPGAVKAPIAGPVNPLDTLEKVYEHLYYQDQANAARNLQSVRRSPLTDLVLQTITQIREAKPFPAAQEAPEAPEKAAAAEETPEAPRRGRGRPRKDGTPAQPRTEEETVAYIKAEDGSYRKRGRGRTKRGEETVHLTPAEIAELGLED